MTDPNPVGPLPNEHYVSKLAITAVVKGDGTALGAAPVRAELFAPGTTRVRAGLLATLVDVVAGHAPNGPIGPTVDLRLQLFSAPPVSGRLHTVTRPLRVGTRLVVAETVLHSDDSGSPRPFARALTTFMNIPVGPGLPESAPVPPMAEASFDEFLGARVVDYHTLELDPVRRLTIGDRATVQGGAQALLAELAAEHLLAGGRPVMVTDLDIRYLGRVRVGPLRARAEDIGDGDGPRRVRVTLTDAGSDDRIVAFVALTLLPAL